MRSYAGARTVTTTPGATAGPQLTAIANRPFTLVEVGVFNTTTTAFAIALQRFTATGTLGAAVVARSEDDAVTPAIVPTGVNSTASTLQTGFLTQASIGAAIGAGVIWTFGKNGIRSPAATTNGFTLVVPIGTGQHFDFYWVWEE